MKFKKGEKVIIKTYKHIPDGWNHRMMDLIGKTVTIHSTNTGFHDWPYSISERLGWVWKEENLLPIISKKDPNYIFMCRRR